jgi:hypothetical protein
MVCAIVNLCSSTGCRTVLYPQIRFFLSATVAEKVLTYALDDRRLLLWQKYTPRFVSWRLD